MTKQWKQRVLISRTTTGLGSSCGSGGRPVASISRGPWFKSSHQEFFIVNIFSFNCWKMKIKICQCKTTTGFYYSIFSKFVMSKVNKKYLEKCTLTCFNQRNDNASEIVNERRRNRFLPFSHQAITEIVSPEKVSSKRKHFSDDTTATWRLGKRHVVKWLLADQCHCLWLSEDRAVYSTLCKCGWPCN